MSILSLDKIEHSLNNLVEPDSSETSLKPDVVIKPDSIVISNKEALDLPKEYEHVAISIEEPPDTPKKTTPVEITFDEVGDATVEQSPITITKDEAPNVPIKPDTIVILPNENFLRTSVPQSTMTTPSTPSRIRRVSMTVLNKLHLGERPPPKPDEDKARRLAGLVERRERRELNNFMRKAEPVLEKYSKLKKQVTIHQLTTMEREDFLQEMKSYQRLKEKLSAVLIVWWCATIFLGLITMAINTWITDTVMYIIWADLALLMCLVALVYKLFNRNRLSYIINKFEGKKVDDVVIRNNNAATGDFVLSGRKLSRVPS